MQRNGDMKPRKHIGARGALMVEVLVTGMMVAVASLGAAAALISGLTLEQRSERTMAEVATAENVMERIRHKSMTNFEELSNEFRDSVGAGRTKRSREPLRNSLIIFSGCCLTKSGEVVDWER